MKKDTGREGEKFALKYLKRKGYRILASNYSTPVGELDIVAMDGDTLVFVEVKTRTTLLYGHPFEAVNAEKQRRLKRLALYYMKAKKVSNTGGRFDVMSLRKGEGGYQVNHIIDAFEV